MLKLEELETIATRLKIVAMELGDDRSSRDISLAQTHIEDAVLRLEQHLRDRKPKGTHGA